MFAFENAVVSPKDGYSWNDAPEGISTFYAKLSIAKGLKVNWVKSLNDFLLSKNKEHIRASMFYINSKGMPTPIEGWYCWVNVCAEIKKLPNMFFVELIPLQEFDISKAEVVSFK